MDATSEDDEHGIVLKNGYVPMEPVLGGGVFVNGVRVEPDEVERVARAIRERASRYVSRND